MTEEATSPALSDELASALRKEGIRVPFIAYAAPPTSEQMLEALFPPEDSMYRDVFLAWLVPHDTARYAGVWDGSLSRSGTLADLLNRLRVPRKIDPFPRPLCEDAMIAPFIHFHEDYVLNGVETSISYALGYATRCEPRKTLSKPSDYKKLEIALVTCHGRLRPSALGLPEDFDEWFDSSNVAGYVPFDVVQSLRHSLASACGVEVCEPVETTLYSDAFKQAGEALPEIPALFAQLENALGDCDEF